MMLQVTEDTPPDMLAGAMDLTVHLPTGRSVKMAVERSTPMMDLLVQITTAHHLQLSSHTLQALALAPSSERGDMVLPFKPNTPIGALDTQDIRVLPKSRPAPMTKAVAPTGQPFESTFRLKVHLPRNQLYVTRVSSKTLLENIMKKVCEEKNLDPMKYELRHPGNLDETLDPKLTLSDYQITEIFVVVRGAVSPNQAFSVTDLMALRKEEERKQMHTKTGGGVFNLIFRRGKSSMGSGSVSSDNRSLSPTHSDDSRSVTPPAAVQQPIMAPPPKKEAPPTDRPRPPQRKRRPAPKPPGPSPPTKKEEDVAKSGSVVSDSQNRNELAPSRPDPPLTICHSRNSSDSSGYHEASILSDHGGGVATSLPRNTRPRSAFISSGGMQRGSTSNLTNMVAHSKSATSLTLAGRKKKAAPPPPPPLKSASSVVALDKPSPLVATQPAISPPEKEVQESITLSINPTPKPRARSTARTPQPPPRQTKFFSLQADHLQITEAATNDENDDGKAASGQSVDPELPAMLSKDLHLAKSPETEITEASPNIADSNNNNPNNGTEAAVNLSECVDYHKNALEEEAVARFGGEKECDFLSDTNKVTNFEKLPIFKKKDVLNAEIVNEVIQEGLKDHSNDETREVLSLGRDPNDSAKIDVSDKRVYVNKIQKDTAVKIFSSVDFLGNEEKKLPEIVAMIPKTPPLPKTDADIESCADYNFGFINPRENKNTDLNAEYTTLISEESMSNEEGRRLASNYEKNYSSTTLKSTEGTVVCDEPVAIQDESTENKLRKQLSVLSLRSGSSFPDFPDSSMRKWDSMEDLHGVTAFSVETRNKWVTGDTYDSESVSSANLSQCTEQVNLEVSHFSITATDDKDKTSSDTNKEDKSLDSTDSGIAHDTHSDKHEENIEDVNLPGTPPPPPVVDDLLKTEKSRVLPIVTAEDNGDDTEIDWQYQLPSPPKAFRDSSPDCTSQSVESDFKDSVVTSPELFEKLKVIEDIQSERGTIHSDASSVISEEERPLNTLSLENLEKRKSLVYNRELSTSLKMTDNIEKVKIETYTNSLAKFESTYEDVKKSSLTKPDSGTINNCNTLPNFKITTYNEPKQKIKVFEDDTIRSNTSDSKRNSCTEMISVDRENYIERSHEALRRNSSDFQQIPQKLDRDYYFFRPQHNTLQKNFGPASSVFRSESFSTEGPWSPSRPVSRSKSQLTLNKYQESRIERLNSNNGMSKSSSLFDVSGLQSLEVMKLIQNKLNTPTTSVENLHQKDNKLGNKIKAENERKEILKEASVEKKNTEQPSEKIYHYQGPPAVNFSTWSERPKVPVAVKEDSDYKLSNNLSSKLIVSTTNNNVTSNNSIEIRNNTNSLKNNDRNGNVCIKINGSEPISQQSSGNVIIKIGGHKTMESSQRLYTPAGYRKPFVAINSNTISSRPHSVAFGNDFDISRLPVVRSVELKKPFKNMQNNNTSITQIYQDNEANKPLAAPNKLSNKYKSHETLPTIKKEESKPVVRINSFKPNAAPAVRGFQSSKDSVMNRLSWNTPNSCATLPTKTTVQKDFSTNQHVPFSQSNLRRTESSKKINYDSSSENDFISLPSIKNETGGAPPPPQMPKVVLRKVVPRPVKPTLDARDQLLESIRNFGGKKGLRAAKVS